MSNSKSQEADLIKNLSANEKRKLMRHIEHSQQGSPKKSAGNQASSVATKGFNVVPKPFNGGSGNKSSQVSKAASLWGANSSSQNAAVKSSNSAYKPVRAPDAKSEHFKIPALNEAHVRMFQAREAGSPPKFKDALRKPSTPPLNRHSSAAKTDAPAKFIAAPKAVFTSNVASHPITKVKPVPKVAATPSSKVSSTPNVVPSKNLQSMSSNPPSFQSRPSSAYKPNVAVKNEKKVSSPLLDQKKPNSNQEKNPVKKAASKENVVSNPPLPKPSFPKAKPSIPPQNPIQTSSTSAPASKPAPAWQQRPEPLSKDKPPAKGSPPTAIVAPIQDNSKRVTSVKAQHNAEASRQRSVSTPVAHQPPSNVAYKAANENVILPDTSLAEKNSVMAKETRVKRSLSEVTKVAAQAKEVGKKKMLGHNFQPHELKDWVNWCDACGSVILSLFGKCVSCTKCKMVCHGKCALAVSLTCEADQQTHSLTLSSDNALSFYKTVVQETKDESTLKEYNTIQRVISVEEVQERIEEFNRTVKGSQQMTLQEDGEIFRGFIRVSMNLTRPVSVIDSSSKTARKPTQHQHKASFYIDKGAMKALHLTSDTTSEEVVKALLLKYSISDNPMKFALFEKQVREEGHVILRKMLPRERPLFLRLLWGNGNSDKRGFTLQENESRDIHTKLSSVANFRDSVLVLLVVAGKDTPGSDGNTEKQWESFSVAELHMFIKILDKEESDYVIEIKRKYKNKSQDIKNAIEHQKKKSKS